MTPGRRGQWQAAPGLPYWQADCPPSPTLTCRDLGQGGRQTWPYTAQRLALAALADISPDFHIPKSSRGSVSAHPQNSTHRRMQPVLCDL